MTTLPRYFLFAFSSIYAILIIYKKYLNEERRDERKMLNKKGFTLVELIVVVIIVGILASVAIPTMTGMTDKAKKSEAIAALGAIRTAQRIYYVENDSYRAFAAGTVGTSGLGLINSDLDGRWFSNACYGSAGSAGAFNANCNSNLSGPPATKAGEVSTKGWNITINQDGNITGG